MATILVEILGNAKQFKAEMAEAAAATEKANGGFAKMGKIANIAGLAIAGGVAVGLVKSVEAAMKAQEATARLNTAFAASHVSAKKFAGGIEDAETKSRKLGFTNEDVKGSLGSLIVATHDGHKAITDLGVAQDIARFKHVSLETATKSLTMAMAGSQRATKALGIDVPKVTSHYDALKATMGKSISPAEKLELSHAKIVDRLATENKVIATVSEKLKGQAEAYSKTAAGGMAAFHAQLGALEERVGKALLPALTKVTDALTRFVAFLSNSPGVAHAAATAMQVFSDVMSVVVVVGKAVLKWMEEHQTATKAIVIALAALVIAFSSPVVAIVALGVALIELWKHSETFRDIVKGAISAVTPYFLAFKAAVEEVAAAVRTHWAEISAVLIAVFDQFKNWLNLIGDLLHGRWGQIWDDVVKILKGEWKIIVAEVELVGPLLLAALKAVGEAAVKGLKAGLAALPGALEAGMKALPGLALTAATLIGEAIVKGVKWAVPHIIGLAGDLTGKISAAIAQVAGWALGEAEKIGTAIVKGVISGIKSMPGAIGGAIKGAVGGGLSWAYHNIGSTADQASAKVLGIPLAQGVIDGWLMGSASLPSKMTTTLQNAINAGRAVIQTAQASFQTAWSQIASDASAAFGGITGAKQTSAEKQLSDEQSGRDKAARQAALIAASNELTAAAVGGDPAAIAAAEQKLSDAQLAIHIAGLQKQAAEERLQLDARNALQQRHFDEALVKLQVHLAKGHSTYAEAHAAILKLFKSFGINYRAAGVDLGAAFVTGLKESIHEAASKSGALSGKLSAVAAGIHVPHAATGGFVAQTGLAVIHQGETITPAGQGGNVNITINGYVSDEHLEQMRNLLIRRGRTTTGGALGGFA